MITLTENLSLEVLLGSAPTTQLPIYASYFDQSDSVHDSDEHRTQTNGLHAVEAVGRPSSGLKRLVDYLTIYNADASAATVTVRLRDHTKPDADAYTTLISQSISSGLTLQYVHGQGFS